VPLDASAMRALNRYGRRRDQLCPRPTSEAFFLSTAGTRLQGPHIHRVSSRLRRTVGLEPRSPRCRPRLHDLRHRLAVNTLIDWYRAEVDVQARLPWLSTYMGHAEPSDTYCGICQPRLSCWASRPDGWSRRSSRCKVSSLAPTLEAFFTDRLLCQRRVSPNTIASYRDTFRLLLSFAQQKTGTPPARLELSHLDAPLIGAFLEHLETERGNTARTRNIRLAAIHSFFQYCALSEASDNWAYLQ
jgi:site-specific recombinase XerD